MVHPSAKGKRQIQGPCQGAELRRLRMRALEHHRKYAWQLGKNVQNVVRLGVKLRPMIGIRRKPARMRLSM